MNQLVKLLQRKYISLAVVTMVLAWHQTGWVQASQTSVLALEKIEVLDLQTAAEIALAENPTLAAAQSRVAQALEAVQQARSPYWPRFDLTASRTRIDVSDNAMQSQLAMARVSGSSEIPANPDDTYTATVSANWLVFDGFTRRFNLAAAKHGAQFSAAARDDAQRLLLQAVSRAFISAQLSLENVAIANADEAFNQRQLKEAKLRQKAGTGALSDVLNFKVKTNSAKSDLILAERTYETSRIALAALLGVESARLPKETRLIPLEKASEAELLTPKLDQSLAHAHAERPDLMQNESGVRQAEAEIKANRGKYYPTLSLMASYGAEGTDGFGFENEDYSSSIGLNLSNNLFAGGLTTAQYRQAKMRLHETQKRLQDVKINVTSEVQTTSQQVLSAQKQLLLQRTNARLVKKNRDLVAKEYKAGVGSLVRLNEAQRDLTAAKVRLASAQVALRRAWYDLWSATGQIKTKLFISNKQKISDTK